MVIQIKPEIKEKLYRQCKNIQYNINRGILVLLLKISKKIKAKNYYTSDFRYYQQYCLKKLIWCLQNNWLERKKLIKELYGINKLYMKSLGYRIANAYLDDMEILKQHVFHLRMLPRIGPIRENNLILNDDLRTWLHLLSEKDFEYMFEEDGLFIYRRLWRFI